VARWWSCRLVLLGVLLLVVGGCATLSPETHNPEESFVVSNDDFMKRLRWKDFSGAAKYFDAEEGKLFREQLRPLEKDLNITDVRLDSAEFQAADKTMETWLIIDYFLLPSNTLRDFRFKLQWSYLEVGGKSPGIWRISSPFPVFPEAAKP